MPITSFLERNAQQFTDEVALVEINPDGDNLRSDNWKEFALVEMDPAGGYRREMSWAEFDRRLSLIHI